MRRRVPPGSIEAVSREVVAAVALLGYTKWVRDKRSACRAEASGQERRGGREGEG